MDENIEIHRPKAVNPFGFFLVREKATGRLVATMATIEEAQAVFSEEEFEYRPWVAIYDGHRTPQPFIYPPGDLTPPEDRVPWEDTRTLNEVLASAYVLISDPYEWKYRGQLRDGNEEKIAEALAEWEARRELVRTLYSE